MHAGQQQRPPADEAVRIATSGLTGANRELYHRFELEAGKAKQLALKVVQQEEAIKQMKQRIASSEKKFENEKSYLERRIAQHKQELQAMDEEEAQLEEEERKTQGQLKGLSQSVVDVREQLAYNFELPPLPEVSGTAYGERCLQVSAEDVFEESQGESFLRRIAELAARLNIELCSSASVLLGSQQFSFALGGNSTFSSLDREFSSSATEATTMHHRYSPSSSFLALPPLSMVPLENDALVRLFTSNNADDLSNNDATRSGKNAKKQEGDALLTRTTSGEQQQQATTIIINSAATAPLAADATGPGESGATRNRPAANKGTLLVLERKTEEHGQRSKILEDLYVGNQISEREFLVQAKEWKAVGQQLQEEFRLLFGVHQHRDEEEEEEGGIPVGGSLSPSAAAEIQPTISMVTAQEERARERFQVNAKKDGYTSYSNDAFIQGQIDEYRQWQQQQQPLGTAATAAASYMDDGGSSYSPDADHVVVHVPTNAPLLQRPNTQKKPSSTAWWSAVGTPPLGALPTATDLMFSSYDLEIGGLAAGGAGPLRTVSIELHRDRRKKREEGAGTDPHQHSRNAKLQQQQGEGVRSVPVCGSGSNSTLGTVRAMVDELYATLEEQEQRLAASSAAQRHFAEFSKATTTNSHQQIASTAVGAAGAPGLQTDRAMLGGTGIPDESDLALASDFVPAPPTAGNTVGGGEDPTEVRPRPLSKGTDEKEEGESELHRHSLDSSGAAAPKNDGLLRPAETPRPPLTSMTSTVLTANEDEEHSDDPEWSQWKRVIHEVRLADAKDFALSRQPAQTKTLSTRTTGTVADEQQKIRVPKRPATAAAVVPGATGRSRWSADTDEAEPRSGTTGTLSEADEELKLKESVKTAVRALSSYGERVYDDTRCKCTLLAAGIEETTLLPQGIRWLRETKISSSTGSAATGETPGDVVVPRRPQSAPSSDKTSVGKTAPLLFMMSSTRAGTAAAEGAVSTTLVGLRSEGEGEEEGAVADTAAPLTVVSSDTDTGMMFAMLPTMVRSTTVVPTPPPPPCTSTVAAAPRSSGGAQPQATPTQSAPVQQEQQQYRGKGEDTAAMNRSDGLRPVPTLLSDRYQKAAQRVLKQQCGATDTRLSSSGGTKTSLDDKSPTLTTGTVGGTADHLPSTGDEPQQAPAQPPQQQYRFSTHRGLEKAIQSTIYRPPPRPVSSAGPPVSSRSEGKAGKQQKSIMKKAAAAAATTTPNSHSLGDGDAVRASSTTSTTSGSGGGVIKKKEKNSNSSGSSTSPRKKMTQFAV